MLLLTLLHLAFATHVTTYEVDKGWTGAPVAGFRSLYTEPASVVSMLKPQVFEGQVPAERYANEALPGQRALVFTNPLSQMADVTINGVKIGVAHPYATIKIDGVRAGDYLIQLATANLQTRSYVVRVQRPARQLQAKVERSTDRLLLSDNIEFEINSATITTDSDPLLAQVVQLLSSSPDILKLRIEGHTDTDGSAEYNQKLSETRAKAVYDYLTAKGIDPARLEVVGLGESKPLDTSGTEAADEKNRRVEFHIVQVAAPAPVVPVKGKRGK